MSRNTNANSKEENKPTHRVKELRERNNLTQEAFAARLYISVSAVRQVEQGARKLSLELAVSIRAEFNASLDWLFGLSNDRNDTAANTLLALQECFNLRKADNPADGLVVDVDSDLSNFLIGINEFDVFMDGKDVSDDIKNAFIDEQKQKYNDKLKSKSGNTYETYALVPIREIRELRMRQGHRLPNSTGYTSNC